MQRPSPRFRSVQFFKCKIFGEMVYPNLQSFVQRCHDDAHLNRHQHGSQKPAEISVTEFCYESANIISQGNTNIKSFSNTMSVQIAKSPQKSTCKLYILKSTQCLSRLPCNCHFMQKLRNSRVLCDTTKNPFEEKMCGFKKYPDAHHRGNFTQDPPTSLNFPLLQGSDDPARPPPPPPPTSLEFPEV